MCAAQQYPEEATTTVVVEESERENVQQVIISPERRTEPRVRWSANTIDNEFLGRHKSKCCCIYKKPKKWDDDSDDDENSDCETNHCRGHVEKRAHPHGGDSGDAPGPSCPA